MYAGYPDLHPPATAPEQSARDIFNSGLVSLEDVRAMCNDILALIGKEETNHESQHGQNKDQGKTVSIKEKVIIERAPWYYPSTTIINNYGSIDQKRESNKSGDEKDEKDTTEKKKTESKEITFTQKAVASGIVAIALPVAAHFLSQDYKKYLIYEKIDSRYRAFMSLQPVICAVNYPKGAREQEFSKVITGWTKVRETVWNNISVSAQNKGLGTLATVGIGLGFVFAMPIAVIGSTLTMGGIAARCIWRKNTADVRNYESNVLAYHAIQFIECYGQE